MNNYNEFYNFLLKNKLIDPVYGYVLDIIDDEIKGVNNKEHYLSIFAMYFCLINDGNICISLDKNILKEKWSNKLNSSKVLLLEKQNFDEEEFNNYYNVSLDIIDQYLSSITEENLQSIIGNNKLFEIDDNYLYVKKYNVARRGVIESIDRIFSNERNITATDDYRNFVMDDFKLSYGQEKAVLEGINKNLIITGGPGTGKTTSILFLLLNLLKNDKDNMIVYLIAPSGKASSRMKESIINGLNIIKDEYKQNNKEIIEKINNLEESTIHRLLGVDQETKGFLYNKKHMFSDNSLFVIDESSMIDVCLFNSLLQAIPTTAKIYIMGDKNQLPSVEVGAVFADLLKKESLQNNIIELDESIRFRKGTKIYELASRINNGLDLEIEESQWSKYDSFEIQPDDDTKPVFYYNINDSNAKDKDIIESVVYKWGKEYYSKLQLMASNIDHNDYEYLNNLFKYTEISKILCAENESIRGVKTINKFIKNNFIDKTRQTSIFGFYPGMLMMINKNNKILDLYNGDCGVLVTFKNDSTLYFMVKKASMIISKEGKENDKIFKLKDFTFYPLRLITQSEIDLSYAITIHKSQGSDYKNILVILPSAKGHPLLNRQIIYTAITRTKGNTYILSNQERLNEAKNSVIIRDTNIY